MPVTSVPGPNVSVSDAESLQGCRSSSAVIAPADVETACSMITATFGDAVRSKREIGQVHEVLCHPLCVLMQAPHESGIKPRF